MLNQKRDELWKSLNTKDTNKEQQDRYRIILDNLLDISPNDPSITTRVDKKNYFDVITQFGPHAGEQIIKNQDFKIVLNDNELMLIAQKLRQASTVAQVEEIAKKYEIELSKNKLKDLENDFVPTRNKLIDTVEAKAQKSSLTWKLFLNKSASMNAENNIWPMHIGFGFISVEIDGKQIYAPLFLKEVTIEITNSVAVLKSNGGLKMNEKLLWFLNNSGFNMELDFNFEKETIWNFVNKIAIVWRGIYDLNINLGAAINLDHVDYSEKIKFHGGMVLGLYQPLGGYARNRMLEIIENQDMENIFDIKFNKNEYEKMITDSIYKKNFGFHKIVATNYSQDKAVVSSLNQDTIIWGPPGTGKSQTIVNILANILGYDRTALVVSEKKAALEVIRNRISELSKFCLFMLNDRNMNKSAFYEPIIKYIDDLEHVKGSMTLNTTSVMEQKNKDYVNRLRNVLAYEKHEELFATFRNLKMQFHNLQFSTISNLYELDQNIIIPRDLKINDLHKEFNKTNGVNIVVSLLNITEKQKKVRQQFEFVKNHFINFNGDLNVIRDEVKQHPRELFQDLFFLDEREKNKNDGVIDDKILSLFIQQKIAKKIEHIQNNPELWNQYKSFASAVRLKNLEPHRLAKDYLEIIKLIYPVIITTPDADLSGWKKAEFDYVIIDESSQIFIEKGIPILYLGKIKILAGDDKQMKPSRWFSTRSNDESVFGNVDSLLDYALSYGVHKILLDKNYRSKSASLMTFSSKHFYESKLDVVDDFKALKFKAMEVIQTNGVWEDGMNREEIKIAIDLAKQELNKFEKIIILTFNAKQLNEITNQIFASHPDLEQAVNNEELLLRNIENIQGDEADLIIATLVYDANSKVHATYVGRPGGANALNVAISRARSKMIVIKTINADDLSNVQNNEDLLMFKNWLKFLELSPADKKNYLNKDDEKSETKLPVQDNILINEYKALLQNASLQKDFSLGTISADLAVFNLKDDLQNLVVMDKFNYGMPNSTYQTYIEFNDRLAFLKSKSYPTQIISPLTQLDPAFVNQYVSNSVAVEVPQFENVPVFEQDEEVENNESESLIQTVSNIESSESVEIGNMQVSASEFENYNEILQDQEVSNEANVVDQQDIEETKNNG